MSNTKKITIGVICFLVLSIVTVVVPFQRVEKNELSWTNERLSELKIKRGVNYLEQDDPEVMKILDAGSEMGVSSLKSTMKNSGTLVTIYAILLGIFIYRMRTSER